MTDRIKGFTVVLAQDVREDDFEAIENVVRMIKGVQSVHRHVADSGDYIIAMRIRSQIAKEVYSLADAILDSKSVAAK